MSNTPTKGCPRCDDYDEVLDELKNEQKQREQKTKDALAECESKRKHLEKRLVTVGIIVIVILTLFGKEFIDKVSDYMNSLNKVKDAATSLTTQATPPKKEQSEDENIILSDDESITNDSYAIYPAPRRSSDIKWPADDSFFSIIDILTDKRSVYNDTLLNPTLFNDDNFSMITAFDIYDLTSFTPNLYDAPDSYGNIYSAPRYTNWNDDVELIVPETSTLGIFAFSLFRNRKRRS